MMNRIDVNAPVTIGFALIALVVLILSGITGGWTNQLLFSVYGSSFADSLTYVRLFGHVLGHGSFQHYFSNMAILLLIGPLLEEKYGSGPLALSMAITALCTGLLQMLLFPREGLLGASGLVFMMILMSSFANFKKGKIPLSLILIAVLYLGQEVVNSLVLKDQVSQFAHLVGGVAGAVIGYVLNVQKAPAERKDGLV